MKGRTIARLAAEAGVNVETIRYYERIGVLDKPKPSASGWRQYSEHVLRTVNYIKSAQKLGFSLAEIKTAQRLCLAQTPPLLCRSIRDLAARKMVAVEEQIRDLEQLRARLQQFIRDCAAKPDAERCPVSQAFRGMKAGG